MRAGKPVIGLAGGIGSGKSAAASILAELGAAIIDSDQLNHEELSRPEVVNELRRWWGDRVLRPDGTVDRAAIREIVVADSSQRERLERLVHPRIARRSKERMRRLQRDRVCRAIVWDAPLLYEANLANQCDCVIFVDDAANAPVDSMGPLLERHKSFPNRTNVEFAQITEGGHIVLRVWERGVGGTEACGTGACAVCVAAVLTGRSDRNSLVQLPGGVLEITWSSGDNCVYMTGPAVEVFQGSWPDD